jgi:protein-S-isoprenylcysteine O-methyltransferase Ste14
MSELVAWTVLALLLALTEVAFAPARSGSRSPQGEATDRLVQMLTVVAIVGPPLLALILRSPPGVPALAIGVGIAASGIALRVVAMRVLGERFQLTPREVSEAPRLVTSGPYAVIRHPGYAALLLAFSGLALVGGGVLGLLFMAPLVGGVVVRIAIEEEILRAEFGASHVDYVKETPWMLLPRIR